MLKANLIALLGFASGFNLYASTGCVGIPKNHSMVVELKKLPRFKQQKFSNKFITIELSKTLNFRDSNYCYSENDERFAYVQAYYYGTLQAEFYNRLLIKNGFKRLPKLQIKISKASLGEAPHGASDFENIGKIDISFSSPMFDPTLLTHEIGHTVHGHMSKKLLGDILVDPMSDVKTFYAQLGVIEGIANLFSALSMNLECVLCMEDGYPGIHLDWSLPKELVS